MTTTSISPAAREGKAPIYRFVRPRTLIYAEIIVLVGAVMAYALATRSFTEITVRHDRNPLFVTLSDGSTRNAYTVHLLNKRPETRTIRARHHRACRTRKCMSSGSTPRFPGQPAIPVGPDQGREIRVLVTVPPGKAIEHSTPLTFSAVDTANRETAKAQDHFIAN